MGSERRVVVSLKSLVQDHVEWRTVSGTPIEAHGMTITPRSWSIVFHFGRGGFVFNRPVGLRVEREGETETIPILNINRIVKWSMVGAWIGGMIVAWRLMQHES
jgi:hypothetical protein